MCPLCESLAEVRYDCFALPINDCQSCNHQFAIPENIDSHILETYDDDYFFGDGAGYENYLDESRLLIARGEYYGTILAKHINVGSVVDVGSAAGFLLKGMANKGWAGLGVEPNQRLVKYAQESLGIHSICSSFESFAAERQFDAVSMIQVISHVVNAKQAIVKAAELLIPGGLLLIETWDRSSWTARLLGRRWHEYSPPSVLHWFTRARLTQLISEHGFTIVESGRPQRWIQVGHAKSLLRHKYGTLLSTALAWLPSNLQIPYFGDDLIYVIARRNIK